MESFARSDAVGLGYIVILFIVFFKNENSELISLVATPVMCDFPLYAMITINE